MKGIVLAGGSGTRLYPITRSLSKQLVPIYDKPMIYYPLSILMLANIKEVLIISTPEDTIRFEELLGDGSQWGMSLSYKIQQAPNGIAEAFILGEDFIGDDNVALILGDNIYYGHGLTSILTKCKNLEEGAIIFGYFVNDPSRYGVVEFDADNNVLSLEEKPNNPKSNYAVPGLYFYDNKVVALAKALKPSQRGELEITDLNKEYLNLKQLKVELLGRGFAWLDTGTHESLFEASNFVKIIEDRQGLKIACLEEIALYKKFINKRQFEVLANKYNNQYGKYLRKILDVEVK